jgi:isopentenyl diphosphate isomerase/L-lactate dehydrogenase-like FMN-dependent dehydrogenase
MHPAGRGGGVSTTTTTATGPEEIRNVFDFEALARVALGEKPYAYLSGGADDERTLAANRSGFEAIRIRCRRLVDVSTVQTRTRLLDLEMDCPIVLCPVGFQGQFHPDGECATARAAAARNTLLIVSSASTWSVGEIADAGGGPLWFQLYPTPDRRITRGLLERAEAAGCRAVVLTVDAPVIGNRERHDDSRELLGGDALRMGNYEGLRTDEPVFDPTMTWDMISWLREHTRLAVVIKGIVTREDAALCVEHGADALVVSNHGGRQEESGRGTIECLPEVVEAVAGRLPVLIDGGVRRGTDVFKALALGADAICIGRPYIWGLSAAGRAGVEQVIDLLRTELVRTMQLAGTARLADIGPDSVIHRR